MSTLDSDFEVRRALLQRALSEREKRRRRVSSRYTRYQDDPVGFIENELLGFVWSKQRDVCESVLRNRRTAVQSCHSSGKTALAGRIAAWWLSVWPVGEAKCVTLAPGEAQVKAQLWAEINRVHGAGGLPGTCNQTEWKYDKEIVGVGRSPKDTDPAALQGYHARRVLVILDEACGLSKALVDSADTLVTNDDCRILAIGNPDDPNTEFGKMCENGSNWNTIKISAFDTPNFTDEPVPDWLRHLLVSPSWVEEKRRDWGEQSPLWTSKVLGLFPEQSTDSLIPLSALRAALTRDSRASSKKELGLDIARFGDDSSVGYYRCGDFTKRILHEQNRDLMYLCGKVIDTIREFDIDVLKLDDIGLGGGVTDRLNELQRDGHAVLKHISIVPIHVGEPVDEGDPDADMFRNKRSQFNWKMRGRFMEGSISIGGDTKAQEELLSQAAQIKYKYSSRGEIIVEEKSEYKKRLKGKSPDDWDALVLAFAEYDTTIELMRRLGMMPGVYG